MSSDNVGLDVGQTIQISSLDQGRPPPIYLKNGPNNVRHCTDILCCFIFLILTGGFCYFWFLAFINGNPQIISHPMDGSGQLCGYGKLTDYPLIYFATPNEKYLYRTICVKQCPNNVQDPQLYNLECSPNNEVTSCKYTPNADPKKQILIYNTIQLGSVICQPVDQTLQDQVQAALFIGWGEKAVRNIYLALPLIGTAAGITFVMALTFTCLLTFMTSFITWLFLIIYIVFTAIAGLLTFYLYLEQPFPQLIFKKLYKNSFGIIIPNYPKSYGFKLCYLVTTIILWYFSVHSLLTVLLNFTKIKYMICLVKLSTEFVLRNISIILVPFFLFILIIIALALWLLASIEIISLTEINYMKLGQVLPFQHLIPTEDKGIKLLINFIGLMWLRQYIVNLGHYLSASTSCTWYLTANQKPQHSILLQNLKQAFFLHNGSITAGTLFMFFFGILADFFNYFNQHLYKYKNRSDQFCLNCLSKCFFFCCCCCEGCFEMINDQAYTMVCLESTDYLNASKQAILVTKRNFESFDQLRGLSESFTHFGKVFIFLINMIGGCFYMVAEQPYKQIITVPIYPAIIIGFVTYSTASLFMSMFGQIINSLILTYIIDLEVERYHYGREECGSCPYELLPIVHDLKQKRKLYFK